MFTVFDSAWFLMLLLVFLLLFHLIQLPVAK